jgi:hypothetical protein
VVPGYEILGVLGRGGMGVVYKAHHLALKRSVALKMILAGGHASEQDLARFRAEAEAVARVQHPHIVQIHEVGEAGGLPYCVLELVEGGSLAKKLAGQPLPASAAAQIVQLLAEAMHLAHSRNIIHRDLKPANVLLTTEGQPKITDFGLAKKLDDASGQTAIGAIVGTPSYMAPEQAGGQSKEVGPLADVYALGAILYECLTARPPFKAATTMDTLLQVLSVEPVPPSKLQPKVPRDLETICLKCLSKEPERRYASARELAEDLGRFRRGEPIQARPVGALERLVKWVQRRPAVAGLLAAVLVVGVVGGGLAAWFALQAQAARLREADERSERLRGEVEAANTAREKDAGAIAEMLVRQVGYDYGQPTPAEMDALWTLAGLDNDRARQLFFEKALAERLRAIRVGHRRDWAVQAAVGLNPDLRDQLVLLLRRTLRGDREAPEVREACADFAVALGEPDAELAWEARGALLEAMAQSADVLTTETHAQDLATLAEWLPAEERSRYFAETARAVLELIPKTNNPLLLAVRARALGQLAERLPPNEAGNLCAQAVKPLLDLLATDPASLGPALAKLAERLPPAAAASAVGPVLDLMAKTADPNLLAALAPALGKLAERLPPEAVVQPAQRAVGLPPWNPALRELAGRLPPAEAARMARQVLKMMTDSKPPVSPATMSLAPVLGKLADRLPPDEAAQLCTNAAEPVLDYMASSPFPGVPQVTYVLKELLVRLPSEQAAKLWVRAAERALVLMPDKPQPINPGEPFFTMQALGELTERLPPEQASALSVRAVRKALDLLAKFNEANFQFQVARGLGGLARHLPPAEAARAARAVLDQMAGDPGSPYMLLIRAEVLGKLAEQLPPEEGARTARAVVGLMAKTSGDPHRLSALAPALGRLAQWLPPDEAADLCAKTAVLLLDEPARFNRVSLNDNDAAQDLSRLAARCRDQDLVDLLKHPFAVGLARTTLQTALNQRLVQDFKSRWDLVVWVPQHRPDLDLTSPPRHLGQGP